MGRANTGPSPRAVKRPLTATATMPASSVPKTGGSRRPRVGTALRSRKATTMGRAIHGSARLDATISVPNFKKTAATMAITIGNEIAVVRGRITPEHPSARISTPAPKNAPTTSGKLRCCGDGPSWTVPGMDQANPSGWRYSSDVTRVAAPAESRMAKTHEASCAAVSPPMEPTARVTASDPDAENTNPITPLAAYRGPRSRRTSRSPAGLNSGRSVRCTFGTKHITSCGVPDAGAQ